MPRYTEHWDIDGILLANTTHIVDNFQIILLPI